MQTAIKLRGLFVMMALVLLASIGMAYWVGKLSLGLDARVHSLDEVMDTLQGTLSTLMDVETGQRGYILTGDDDYLRPYESGLKDTAHHVSRLKELAASGRLPIAETAALIQGIDDKLTQLKSSVIARQTQGFDAAVKVIQGDHRRHVMEHIRTQTRDLLQLKRAEWLQARNDSSEVDGYRNKVFVAAVIINLVFLAWMYRRIRREVFRRETAVSETLRQKDILATSLASIGDAVMLTDAGTKILFMNPVAEQLTGWTLAEVKGMPCSVVFRIIHEETRKPVESPVDKALRAGAIVGPADHTLLIRRDGIELPIDDSGAPVRAADGGIFGVVLVFRDFTLHNEVEKNLRRSKEEVESASKAKDVFLAALSHELRTPLSPVLAMLSMWENQQELPPTWKADVQMMRRNVELEARIIDDLLDLTRIIRGSLTLNEEKVHLHQLLQATAQMYQAALKQKSIDLHMSLEAGSAWVAGDPARLQQVLWNLLGNAIKFTPKGGRIIVTSITDTSNPTVITVRFQDNGLGMSPETVERLFRPFEQGTEGLSRRLGGLGLGLAISRALIERHHGALIGESEGPGLGSSFTLTLPTLPNAAASAALAPAATLPREAQNVKLLLVEDHGDTAAVLATLLRRAGHTVQVCATIAEALRSAQAAPPDLILSDIGLPDGTGMSLIRGVRAFSDVPAIALTGYGMKEDITQCLEAGFTSHLTKPISFDRLRTEMARVLCNNTAPE